MTFNARGANAMAHVINRKKLPPFQIGNIKIPSKGFVSDTTAEFFETDDEDEAHYMSSILNSRITNQLVKPFQPKGLYGHRDIYRRQLMLSIPIFKSTNKHHQQLSDLSKKCHNKISNHIFKKNTFKSMRNESLQVLKNEIDLIDAIVTKIL